eukprot:3431603-Prymnesium_polylepis.1
MICNHSGLEAMMRCTVCQMTYYCSRSCQQANWTQYRAQCNELKSQNNGISILDLNKRAKRRSIFLCFDDA